jgi:CRISPR-associated protein Cmr2
MRYLLIIGVGPVQEFIASARRSRDLWFGSWLLSEISKAAAKKIADECEITSLIFPSVENDEDLKPVKYDEAGNQISGPRFNVVNKIVALIEKDPAQFCPDIEKAAKERLESIWNETYEGIKGKTHIEVDKARLQVDDLIEFYWAAHPVKDDLSDYAQARKEAEALLAARKNLRDFKDASGWASHKPKSSLDGFRESVIKEGAPQDREQRRKQLGLREGEQLCGVGLLKRHGNRRGDGSFFSTSHVAALPLLEKLKDKKAIIRYLVNLAYLLGLIDKQELQKTLSEESPEITPPLRNRLRDEIGFVPERATKKEHESFGRWDGHILFEERLAEFFTDKDKLKDAKQALRKFLKRALDNERPKPYYALLHADGDRMGEAIDEKKTRDGHKLISSSLSNFAGEVREIVEVEHGGSLVYAGGDDVLAFLPLHESLFCARKLADKFRDSLAEFKNTEGKSPTLSVGIAVGHHLDPLQDTLGLARKAEKAAKKLVEGKNALAIIVSKRSGANWLVKGSWCDGPANEKALDNRLNYFIYLHLAEVLPRGVGYELRDAALRLRSLDEPLRTEALRIIKRKRVKNEKLRGEVFKRMERYLEDKEITVDDLANQLIVARPFAEAMKQANINAKTFAQKAKLEELAGLEAELK